MTPGPTATKWNAKEGEAGAAAPRAAAPAGASGRITMRATYLAPAEGLTVTLERAELTAVEGATTHDLTVWVRGIAEPFRVALPEAEVRRVLALWGERARAGGAELRVQD
jgi:hypothetical protein